MASLIQLTKNDIAGKGNKLYVTQLVLGKPMSKDFYRGFCYEDNGKDYGSDYSRSLAERKRGYR